MIVRWRTSPDTEEEHAVARRHCELCYLLGDVPADSTVCARYSALPYYREVEAEVVLRGSRLANTWRQHRYVADLGEWTEHLAGLTPRTWDWHTYVQSGIDRPVVLKGATNSKKFLWSTHMYAANREAAIQVMLRLREDSLVGDQGVWVREYVPLRRLTTGPHGLPISEEYRFFVLDGRVICGGFYWSSHADEVGDLVGVKVVPEGFLAEVTARVGDRCRFYALDVARTGAGEWIVVELNDGQMAGPSECDLGSLYRAIAAAR